MASRTLRLGTRGSALAFTQARWVAERLVATGVVASVELVIVTTSGDRTQASGLPLAATGGEGVFVKEIELALVRNEIDLAVHSLKDLATRLEPGLRLAAVPAREDPRDVLVSRHGLPLERLPARPRIGTSSPRRAAQVLAVRPDAEIVNLRGNLDTRLAKAATDEYDAILLAAAGLHRLGRREAITAYLPVDRFVPMVGQAALGLETRADDAGTIAAVRLLDDPVTHCAVRAERAFLATLGSGCSAPVGAHATVRGDRLRLVAMLGDSAVPGRLHHTAADGPQTAPEALGAQVAATLLSQAIGRS